MADEDERVASSLEAKLEETKHALDKEKEARKKVEKELEDKSRAFNQLYAVATRLACVSAQHLKQQEEILQQTAGELELRSVSSSCFQILTFL